MHPPRWRRDRPRSHAPLRLTPRARRGSAARRRRPNTRLIATRPRSSVGEIGRRAFGGRRTQCDHHRGAPSRGVVDRELASSARVNPRATAKPSPTPAPDCGRRCRGAGTARTPAPAGSIDAHAAVEITAQVDRAADLPRLDPHRRAGVGVHDGVVDQVGHDNVRAGPDRR